jgi:hypothetical protein
MSGQKFRALRQALNTTAEIAAFFGLCALVALGWKGSVDGWPLAMGVLGCIALWGGLRFARLGPNGLEFSETKDAGESGEDKDE